MKTTKVITMDENGEITRELTILCDGSSAEAMLFHLLLEKALACAQMNPKVRVRVGGPSAQKFLELKDIADDVPLEG